MSGQRSRLVLLALAALVLPACTIEQDLAPRSVAPGEARQVSAPVPVPADEPDADEPDADEPTPTGAPPGTPTEAPTEVETGPPLQAAEEPAPGSGPAAPDEPPAPAPAVTANVPPVARDDQVSTPEDTPVTIAVLDDDFDPDGDPLELVRVATPSHGTAEVVGDRVVYTPGPDVNGRDTFTYTIVDPSGDGSTATVSVDIAAVNDVPVAVDDAAGTREDQTVAIDVLANDHDVDGDDLAIAEVGSAALGDVTIVGDELRYVPAPDVSGTDEFTYTVVDPSGATDQAAVAVVITPLNDTPVAADDTLTVDHNAAATIVDVLANDHDVDGDPLTVRSVTQPDLGVASLVGGVVSFRPDPGASGTTTFNYRVSDGRRSDLGQVTVTIRPAPPPPPNRAPVAVADGPFWVVSDGSVLLEDLLANDADPDGDPLTIEIVTLPTVGTVVVVGGTKVEYTHVSGSGALPDTFSYRVSDGVRVSAPVAVTLIENTPPTPVDDAIDTTLFDGMTFVFNPVTGAGDPDFFGSTDTDADGHTLSYAGPKTRAELVTAIAPDTIPAILDFSCDDAGACTFTADELPACTPALVLISYPYTVVDEFGASAEGTVDVEITIADDECVIP